MIRRHHLALIAVTTLAWTGTVQAHKPHQHGLAKLDIAYEAGKLTIELDSPLDSLVGFERAPRTDAERKSVDDAVARLRAGQTMFVIDPAAGCSLEGVELASAPLGLGGAGAPAEKDGHADLEGRWTFACSGAAPAFVDVGLFGAFRRMNRLEVQVVSDKGQRKVTLRRAAGAAPRVELPR